MRRCARQVSPPLPPWPAARTWTASPRNSAPCAAVIATGTSTGRVSREWIDGDFQILWVILWVVGWGLLRFNGDPMGFHGDAWEFEYHQCHETWHFRILYQWRFIAGIIIELNGSFSMAFDPCQGTTNPRGNMGLTYGGFPKSWGYPQIIHVQMVFAIKNHPFGDTPMT